MYSVELAEVSAELSQKVTEWDPLHDRVRKVVNQNCYKMESTRTPIFEDTFWGDGREHAIISAERKARIFLQRHHSRTSFGKVLAFAIALQELCDSGISLSHEGHPVVDLWVLNTHEFDVSDILETRGLCANYPTEGVDANMIQTHQTREKIDETFLQTEKKRSLSAHTGRSHVLGDMKQFHPKSYQQCISHWWVAAIVEGPSPAGEGRQNEPRVPAHELFLVSRHIIEKNLRYNRFE